MRKPQILGIHHSWDGLRWIHLLDLGKGSINLTLKYHISIGGLLSISSSFSKGQTALISPSPLFYCSTRADCQHSNDNPLR